MFDLRDEIDKETEAYKHDAEVYKARFAAALANIRADIKREAGWQRRFPLPGFDNVYGLNILRAVRDVERKP